MPPPRVIRPFNGGQRLSRRAASHAAYGWSLTQFSPALSSSSPCGSPHPQRTPKGEAKFLIGFSGRPYPTPHCHSDPMAPHHRAPPHIVIPTPWPHTTVPHPTSSFPPHIVMPPHVVILSEAKNLMDMSETARCRRSCRRITTKGLCKDLTWWLW